MKLPASDSTTKLTYSSADLVAVSLLAAVVAVWAGLADGAFSVRVLLACEALFFTFYLVGSLFSARQHLAAGLLFDLPLRLLVGYAVVNTALLVLAWVSPLGIVANFGLLLALAVFFLTRVRERRRTRGEPTALWAVGLCVVATTLWCQDSIRPTFEHAGVVVFKPWIDGFYHAVHIRIFGASHGAASIEDFRMAGVVARPYHYGMYLLPAFVKQASGIHSYSAFAGILAPVGTLFTGFSAYALFGSLFGARSGLAACAALLLLPDGAQQGMQNTFMSYHWLTQISPSATYGLALLAVAWLFVIQGCTQGNRLQLLAGWLLSGVVAFYKLHYVVASALLLLLVPAVAFRANLSLPKRVAWAVGASLVYGICLGFGQRVPGVPLVRFDGSAVGEILRLIQTFAAPGALREFIVERMGPQFPWTNNLLYGVPYVAFAVLGLFVPALLVLVPLMRRRTSPLVAFFPVLLCANFLVMFFGLALDFDSSTPDELSHRPLMIVYFFVVAWIGGALGFLLVESARLRAVSRHLILGAAGLLLSVPAFLGSGVQLMWAMPKLSPVRVPAGLVRVAEYLWSHGGPDDVFQDSQFDRTYTISALSERRSFVSHTMTNMPYRGDMVAARTTAVDRLMGLRDGKLVVGTARTFGLRWFILHRGNRVQWPAEIADKPAFKQGPFTVYEF